MLMHFLQLTGNAHERERFEKYTNIVYNTLKKDIYDVTISAQALKDLKKVPLPIALKLQAWIEAVGHNGLSQIRKILGYHSPKNGS